MVVKCDMVDKTVGKMQVTKAASEAKQDHFEGKDDEHPLEYHRNTRYLIMSRDKCVGEYDGDVLPLFDESLLPLCLQSNGSFEDWLSTRVIDGRRTNARLLKKALRLEHTDDISTALHINAATITDTYWVMPFGNSLKYDDIRFHENNFDTLALRGDPDAFNRSPSRTPELTSTGSFEKCWRLIDGKWWMYKSENAAEQFTELFAYHLAKALGIPVAEYEHDRGYIRTLDFTNSASVNFETAYGIIGNETDCIKIYRKLLALDADIAASYIQMKFFDALIYNMDRHEHNFGVFRDVERGKILGMAPLYDHNIALITRGFPADVTRVKDRSLEDFVNLVHKEQPRFALPVLTSGLVTIAAIRALGAFSGSSELPVKTVPFVGEFIMNGYRQIKERTRLPVMRTDRSEPGR